MMNFIRRVVVLVALVLCVSAAATGDSISAQGQPPKQQEEYVPIDQLPPGQELPAAPLLIGAYVFVPAVLFLYLLSLSKRMSRVQLEMQRLESELKRSA